MKSKKKVDRKVHKKWHKKKSLYDQYLADSGDSGDSSGEDTQEEAFECDEYNVNMDVNILIQQTLQNIIQSVCLEDPEGFSTFGDHELICFAAAVKHNSSILSLQIRYLDVSDVSLMPLCKALHQHPSIRAVDLSGTRGGDGASKALRELVCSNPNIIFMRLEDTMLNSTDSRIIEKATRYNAMACPDPNNNPFHLGLLRRISAMDEDVHKFHEQLQARPWLHGDTGGANGSASQKKAKKVLLSSAALSHIGGEVCAQFIQGRCPYGSRCKYIHPERTTALKNVVASSHYNRTEQSELNETVSTALSTAAASRQRLQSRLRPPAFMLKRVELREKQPESRQAAPPKLLPHEVSAFSSISSWWIVSATVICCCTTVAVCL